MDFIVLVEFKYHSTVQRELSIQYAATMLMLTQPLLCGFTIIRAV